MYGKVLVCFSIFHYFDELYVKEAPNASTTIYSGAQQEIKYTYIYTNIYVRIFNYNLRSILLGWQEVHLELLVMWGLVISRASSRPKNIIDIKFYEGRNLYFYIQIS